LIKITGNSGLYGRHAAKKYGVVFSEAAVTDGGTAAQGELGQIVIDGTDGKVAYIDTSGKTQELS